MDQHKPTSIDRIQELGAGKEAIQTFDLVKKQSELMQVKEKLGQRLSEIEEKLKTLEGDLRKINKDSCLQEATTVYKDVSKTLDNLYQNLKKLQVIHEKEITNKYSLKGDLEPKEANLQNLTQQLQEKRQKIEEPKKLASKLKNSGELIDQHLNRRPDQLPSLEEALQFLETTINYTSKLGESQDGNDNVKPESAKESSNLNRSDHSQVLQQLRDVVQHLKGIESDLKVCEGDKVVPKVDNISQLIKDEQRNFFDIIDKFEIDKSGMVDNPKYKLKLLINLENEKCCPINDKEAFRTKKTEAQKISKNFEDTNRKLEREKNSISEMLHEKHREKYKEMLQETFKYTSNVIRGFLERMDDLTEFEVYRRRKKDPELSHEEVLQSLSGDGQTDEQKKLQEQTRNYQSMTCFCATKLAKAFNPAIQEEDVKLMLKNYVELGQEKCGPIDNQADYDRKELESNEKYSGVSSETTDRLLSKFANILDSDSLSKDTRAELVTHTQDLVQMYADRVKLIIKYKSILQELRDYQRKTYENVKETLKYQIKEQRDKLNLEVKANTTSIQSAEETLNLTKKDCRSLTENIRDCENTISTNATEIEKHKETYKNIEKNIIKKYKEIAGKYNKEIDESIITQSLRKKDEIERGKEALNKEKEKIKQELKNLEQAQQSIERENSYVGQVATGAMDSLTQRIHAEANRKRLPIFESFTSGASTSNE